MFKVTQLLSDKLSFVARSISLKVTKRLLGRTLGDLVILSLAADHCGRWKHCSWRGGFQAGITIFKQTGGGAGPQWKITGPITNPFILQFHFHCMRILSSSKKQFHLMFPFNFRRMTSDIWKDLFGYQECACVDQALRVMPLLYGSLLSQTRRRECPARTEIYTQCPQHCWCLAISTNRITLTLHLGSRFMSLFRN